MGWGPVTVWTWLEILMAIGVMGMVVVVGYEVADRAWSRWLVPAWYRWKYRYCRVCRTRRVDFVLPEATRARGCLCDRIDTLAQRLTLATGLLKNMLEERVKEQALVIDRLGEEIVATQAHVGTTSVPGTIESRLGVMADAATKTVGDVKLLSVAVAQLTKGWGNEVLRTNNRDWVAKAKESLGRVVKAKRRSPIFRSRKKKRK